MLYWISPTISAFMWWYAAMGACQSLISAVVLWRLLPASKHRPIFNYKEIHDAGRFAGGLVTISALSIAVMQLDRIVVSAMRPLAELGYFSLALGVASGMGRMIQPMFNALYPRYSRLVAAQDFKVLTQLYHLSNQYLAVVIAATSAVLIVFSKDVLYLWTGDADIATKVAMPLSILVAGTALNGLMNLPYAIQLAHGWTRLAIGTNLVALALGIPFCILAVAHFGITGAAGLWFVVNLAFVAIAIPMMHRRFLRGEMTGWYIRDILPPFIAAFVTALLAAWLTPVLSRDLAGLLILIAISSTTLLAAGLAASPIRIITRQRLKALTSRGH